MCGSLIASVVERGFSSVYPNLMSRIKFGQTELSQRRLPDRPDSGNLRAYTFSRGWVMAEEAKKSGCLKVAGFGALVLVGLGVIGALAGGDAPAGDASAPTAPPLAVTAQELFDAYSANEVAAQARFDGQRLAVTGVVQDIALDLLDEPVVSLQTSNEFMPVRAQFDKADAAATGALTKGQELTVTCGKVTEVVGTPMLDDCVLP
jgi:hypothetical protein